MDLRTDSNQWIIYNPNTVDMVFRGMQAAALIHFGAALQRRAKTLPAVLSDNIGIIGKCLWQFGEAAQEVNMGLAPNEVPDELVFSARGWNEYNRWLKDPSSVPVEKVAGIVDQIAAALAYLDERTRGTGTNHPRWNSRLVSGQPCEECGR